MVPEQPDFIPPWIAALISSAGSSGGNVDSGTHAPEFDDDSGTNPDDFDDDIPF